VFTHHRKSLDLNGTWKFNPDPYQRCKQQQWWKHTGTDNSFFPCWEPQGLWDIHVPGTWKTQFEELKWFDGDANYVRDFELTPEQLTDLQQQEAFLVFDGVVYQADVYVNGHHVARHEHGYSPFHARVTDYLRQRNRIFVCVDNKLSPDRVPGVRFDWNNDGGIIGGVKLIFVPATHIQNFRTWTRIDETNRQAIISAEISLSSRDVSAEETVTFEIPELHLSAHTNVTTAKPGQVQFTVPLSKIRLWSPEDPKLYTTRVVTSRETLADEIGYREVRTQDRDVLLNGKPIRFYGICVHSEFPDTGRTATQAGIEAMISRIKELGCNFVRCAHYPYSELWGRAMDRAGLMWWEEVPVYWLPTIQRDDMTAKALGMLKDTIVRDWNRASLVIWSVSNECAGDAGFSFDLKGGNYPYWVKATALVRELDPSRLISSADSGYRRTLGAGWTPDKADAFDTNFEDNAWLPAHPDAFYELLDVLSGNVYVTGEGHGLTAYHKYVEMLRRYNKPLMVSEFGFMSLRGSDDMPGVTDRSLGSEARHCRVLREAYSSFQQLPEITGYMPWCFSDVRVPMHWRWYNAGKGVFRYGLLDEHWNEKKAWSVVKEETAKLKQRFATEPSATRADTPALRPVVEVLPKKDRTARNGESVGA
jgi:beta-glucuronidase